MAAAQSSWVEGANEHGHFTIHNLPFGVFSTEGEGPRVGVAIGDFILDLAAAAKADLFNGINEMDSAFWIGMFDSPTLNRFMERERCDWRAIRGKVGELLSSSESQAAASACLVHVSTAKMHLPATIGDYTDFYSSREHATNVGTMFRGAENALQPNWLHLPVGYHGRSSSVVVSGTDLHRPNGQLQLDNADPSKGSTYGPCRLMDFELEMAFFVGGKATNLGEPVSMADAEDKIFGMVLMNDWSARDIQKWEYVPLGPFGSKNFGTSISPWVVSLDALKPFQCETSAIKQDPTPLPYLIDPDYSSYNIDLSVSIQPEGCNEKYKVGSSNFKHLYWTIKQQLVHHTVTGCNVKAGDLMGSGTISGINESAYGSMLELSWRGSKEVVLKEDGDQKLIRKFLQDGDTVVMEASCVQGDVRVGFGDCTGKVLPAVKLF
jgi:fumarylacetoacetase